MEAETTLWLFRVPGLQAGKAGKSERAITAETGRSGRLQELDDVTEAEGGAEKVEIKEGAVPGKHWTGVELPGSEGGGGAGWEALATLAPGTEARFAFKAANIPGKDSLIAFEKVLASSSPPGVGNCEIGGGVDVEDDEEITASGAADDGPAVAGVIRVEDRLLFVERTISSTTRDEIERTLLWQCSTEQGLQDTGTPSATGTPWPRKTENRPPFQMRAGKFNVETRTLVRT